MKWSGAGIVRHFSGMNESAFRAARLRALGDDSTTAIRCRRLFRRYFGLFDDHGAPRVGKCENKLQMCWRELFGTTKSMDDLSAFASAS